MLGCETALHLPFWGSVAKAFGGVGAPCFAGLFCGLLCSRLLARPGSAGLGRLQCCFTSSINWGETHPSAPQLPQYTPVPLSPKSQPEGTEGTERIA